MNQAFDAFFNFDEDTKLSHVDHFAFYCLTQEVASLYRQPWVLRQLLDTERDTLGIAVDVENAGFDFVTLGETIARMSNTLAPRHIRDVNQTVNALVNTDEHTEISDVADGAFDDRTNRIGLSQFVPRIRLKLTHTKRNTLVLHVDAKNFGFHNIAHFDELGGVLDALVPAHLRDVNKSLDAVFQLDERAIVGNGYHLSAHNRTDGVFVVGLGPWVGTNLFVAQGDTHCVRVELEDFDLELLAHLEDFRRMVDAAIGHIGDVKQTVDAAQVHKCTVIGDVLDAARHDRALGELLDGVFALVLALFLQQYATRQNDVATLLVELDDFEVVGLSHHTVKVLDRAEIHLRTGKECLHADVYTQATLDAGYDVATDCLVGVHGIRNFVPSLHQVSLLFREAQRTGFFRHAVEVHVDLVPFLEADYAIHRGELARANHTLGLVAHIHSDPIVADAKYAALDDRALFNGAFLEETVEEVLESTAIQIDQGCVEVGLLFSHDVKDSTDPRRCCRSACCLTKGLVQRAGR